MLQFGNEWESVWYPDVLGRKFGEEIGAAWGVMAQRVPPSSPSPRVPSGCGEGTPFANSSYSLDSGRAHYAAPDLIGGGLTSEYW